MKLFLFYSAFFSIVLPAFAINNNSNSTFSNQKIQDCGLAQLKANSCLKNGKDATSGLLEELVSKVTNSDMGKTAANKGAGQAANLLCSKEVDEANAKCEAPQ